MGEIMKDVGNQQSLPLTTRRPSFSQSDTSSDSGLSSVRSFPRTQETGKTPGLEEEEGGGGGEEEASYHDDDLEDGDADRDGPYPSPFQKNKSSGNRTRRSFWIIGTALIGAWVVTFIFFLVQRGSTGGASVSGPAGSGLATQNNGNKKALTLEDALIGAFAAQVHGVSWIAGPNGEDGLLLKRGEHNGTDGYLRVEDIRSRKGGSEYMQTKVLMNSSRVNVDGRTILPSGLYPSGNLKTILISSDLRKNWRHSTVGNYWLLDVETQTAQPLDPKHPDGLAQTALWSPNSDAVVFVRDKNIYLRKLASEEVIAITKDGGKNLFYGVPDWVYEEEVVGGDSVTWWSRDGKFIAFLRTNESTVPEYPVQFFLTRPSEKRPLPGLENYPEVSRIKYPKAGAPNPVVDLLLYDVEKGYTFSVELPNDFHDDDRIIFEVVWASDGMVLVKETNRESDVLKVFLIDAINRTGKLVREKDIAGMDGGWVEPTQSTRFIPADATKNRPYDGYIDTVINQGYEHLGYFSPIDNSDPIMLTSGEWQVDHAPSAVDLQRGLVYFIGTKESPTQRHIYRVKLDGSDFRPLTNTSELGYYGISFSTGAGYALLSYRGPEVPWQAVVNVQGDEIQHEETVEENKHISQKLEEYALPTLIYQNVTIDGYTLQVVERRPPRFNPAKKYPVLFHLYGGPRSQSVDHRFTVDYQSYVASNLSYIVVTVDGRGTGYIGREAMCIIRDNIGHYESRDQIETAKIWGKKEYVDETRMAIWGWSYGGYMTLKTLEQDAGRTFQYGMAVAPVTDWRLYDSIYTERYMHTPQHNPLGYLNSSVSNVHALAQNVRFLFMHGVADDNVHLQNSLVLIDKLDLADVINYDMQVFPDSDHSIYFHNGHRVVFERLTSWLINAFNGEWARLANPVPNPARKKLRR